MNAYQKIRNQEHTTEEALQIAVEMLQNIARGKSYNTGEYFDKLMACERALDKINKQAA